MKPIIRNALNVAAGLLLGIGVVGQLAFNGRPNERTESANIIAAPGLPKQLSFAGEPVPLDRWDVRERLDRELMLNYYSHGNILFLIKSANKYFPVITERLKANGVPDDFKYLCIAESNLLPGATSSVGAASFWQFMSGTAPGYGLEVNKEVDLRYDLVRATDAASAYLKSAYQKFGSWTAAAASYNCGQGGYNGQATYQGTNQYYDLLLPEETNRYIFRILAFKHLLENSEQLGFRVADEEKYSMPETRKLTVTEPIPNLATFAKANGTTFKMLRQLNPWLRGRSLPVPAGKSYVILLPAEGKSF
ncbi:MAG: lytic transglycosylase domain-containing protein [Chitinophagaceae bacterium]|nr:MAG: lytic transglycosylase domain-containing protein [Chitinophagaceae bacterium]